MEDYNMFSKDEKNNNNNYEEYINKLNHNAQILLDTMDKLENKTPEELKHIYNSLVLKKEKGKEKQ